MATCDYFYRDEMHRVYFPEKRKKKEKKKRTRNRGRVKVHKVDRKKVLGHMWFTLLGSKDLGTNVFRTLMCIVGKPWSKQVV